MKSITNGYKENVKLFGRQFDSKIIYELNGEIIELSNSDLNSVSPHYESSILKSVMKQLDIDSNVDIPLNTILTYKFGVLVDDEYEYINYGNYIVYKSEKQEDTNSWKLTCYDKLLYSMKDYVDLDINYPISIRDYINEICKYLGINFKNKDTEFANYDKEINSELYLDADGNSLGYTFRDVLDELAQVTASIICINNDDELEIRYVNDTNDTINEEFLKDINVNFGEKYGPINSIVLSRSSGADNIYLKDDESIATNGLCEIKISDNQIMNFNDRDKYLPDILNVLDGLEYYLNDFSSTGITYYELYDRYNISIGENIYSCIMFNDETNITQGLEENIYTNMPEETETDYSKSDKTDRRINQTYLIVDKQNQTINSLVSNVGQYDNRISVVEQNVESLRQSVSIFEDLTRTSKGLRKIHITDGAPTQPLKLSIKNASLLYPSKDLYPSSSLYPKDSWLIIDKTEQLSEEAKMFHLPLTILYAYHDVYDEFIIENGQMYVIHRIGANDDESLYLLQNEVIENLGSIDITLFDNENYIYLYSFQDEGVIYELNYLTHSTLTDVFATTAYVNSSVSQTAQDISLEVEKKIDDIDVINKINVSTEGIELKGNRLTVESDNFNLEANGNITLANGAMVIGDYGMLTNLQFTSSGQFDNFQTLGFGLIYEGNANPEVQKIPVYTVVTIPKNFIIKKATATLIASRTHAYTDQANDFIGYCRNIKLYSESGLQTSAPTYYNTYGAGAVSYDTLSGIEAEGAFGSSGYTASNDARNNDIFELVESTDISEYLEEGPNIVYVMTDINTSSTINNMTDAYSKTGMAQLVIDIIGYTNYPQIVEEEE